MFAAQNTVENNGHKQKKRKTQRRHSTTFCALSRTNRVTSNTRTQRLYPAWSGPPLPTENEHVHSQHWQTTAQVFRVQVASKQTRILSPPAVNLTEYALVISSRWSYL